VDLNRALRDPRERILIQPGDVVLVQQTPGEAFTRYLANALNVTAVARFFTRSNGNTTGTGVLTAP
jgi:hypothetical protein